MKSDHPQSVRIDVVAALAFLLVLGCSIAAAVMPAPRLLHLACAGVVTAYAGYALWHSKRHPVRIAQLGETTYLLGYISTIGGLGAIGWGIAVNLTLLQENISEVLSRGALSLLSTIIGLIGMNIIRSQERKLEETQEEIELIIQRLLPEFRTLLEGSLAATETQRFRSFLETFQSPALAENLRVLAANAAAGAASLGQFSASVAGLAPAVSGAEKQMLALQGATGRFCETTEKVFPVWQQMTAAADEAVRMVEQGATLTQTLRGLQEAAGDATGVMKAQVASAQALQSEVATALQDLRTRLTSVADLGDSVGRFVQLANSIAPTLEALGRTFSDVSDINRHIGGVSVNLRGLNDELLACHKALGGMSTNAEALVGNAGRLVANIQNQVFALEQIGGNMGKAVAPMADLGVAVDRVRQNFGEVEDFSGRLQELVAGLQAFLERLTAMTAKMDEAETVVGDFVRVSRAVLTEAD